MRKTKIILFHLLSTILFMNTVSAQSNSFVAGANSSILFPIGSLSNRFFSTFGGSAFFGKQMNNNWTWCGKLEYFSFEKENSDKLFLTRKFVINEKENTYKLPLPKLSMDLKIAGLSAVANYNIIGTNFFTTDLTFGFGIYYWESTRSSYYDTLRIDTSGGFIDAVILNVPAITQQDWSGGFNLGLDVDVKIVDPIWLNFGANYKVVIGELWAALNLDLENVSTFQMFDLRFGIKAKF